jgi:hypothetical protein
MFSPPLGSSRVAAEILTTHLINLINPINPITNSINLINHSPHKPSTKIISFGHTNYATL